MTRPADPRIIVASHNEGKVREIGELLAPLGLKPISAGSLGLPEPDETGVTFAENALIKAHAAAQASGLPSLADDSGLEVFALGGAPGVYSARWAGPHRDFELAMAMVQRELNGEANRGARFVCALALVRPGERDLVCEGEVRGEIIWPPRGKHGFGYDPIFMPEGDTRTFGEMPAAEKHAVSHRARAFAQLIDKLR